MATVADNDVEEASPAAVINDRLASVKSLEPAADGATGSRENNCTEMQNLASKSIAIEQSVKLLIKDETSNESATSWRNYNLPHSTDLSSLYSTVAKEASYVEGTFRLVWRRQDGTNFEEVPLEDSSATLYETGMPVEPLKTYVLIREKGDGTAVQLVTKQSGAGHSGVVPSTLTKASATTQSSNYSSNYSYYSSSYSYGTNYNMKSETGFVGLVNQAMTCYLNSLLQTLYMTPEFRNALYRWKFEPKDSDDEGKESSKCIPYQLQRLFLQLQTANKRAVETTDITTSFGWDSSEAWQQHDVQELCRVMFDALEKRFMKDKDRQPDAQVDMINELYQGTWQDYVECKTCTTVSARDDTFLDIPLVIKPFGSTHTYDSVEKALKAFVQAEILDGDNQYQCEHCACKRDALKGLKFKKFPYLLTLQLKRFDFDYQNMHRVKLNDKMTFPTLLDLNEFIDDQEALVPLSNDVLQGFSDYVVDRFDPSTLPPSYATATSGQYSAYGSSSVNYSYNDNDDDSMVILGEEKDKESVPQLVKMLSNGPYVYELFSVMVHSGSAIGGHYYAYIKSLTDKRWYCFNDQSVSRITREDLEQTFGGTDKSSRGYYSSMYSSSANAYMLMYRRIGRKNEDFLEHATFPAHLKQQIEDEKKREREAAEMKELDKKMCKFKLLCQHPVSSERMEKRLEVHQDKSLLEALQQAHRLMKLSDVVPLDRCRLVKYDDYTETFDQSLDLDESEQTFGQLVGGARTYYSFELFLEIRKEGEKFQKYGRGGMNLRILVVDVATENVSPPVSIRAEQGWTVMELKQEIGKRFDMNPDTMNLVQELYNDGRHLNNDTNSLRAEGLYRKHNIYSSSDPEDFKKPYQESAMRQIVDAYVNSIMLIITLPPKPNNPPAAMLTTPVEPTSSDVDPPVDDAIPDLMPAKPADKPVSGSDDTSGEPVSDLTPADSTDKPVDSSGDGVSTLTDHLASVSVSVPGGSIATDVTQTAAHQSVTEIGSEHNEIPDLLPNKTTSEVDEGELLGEDESKLIPTSVSQEEATEAVHQTQPTEVREVRVDFPARAEGRNEQVTTVSDSVNKGRAENGLPVEERPKKREIRMRVDRRTTLAQLKEKLEPSVGVASSNFKVYRMYSNNQEYEMERLNDPLTATPSESRLVVRLGRALKPGEHRIKLYLLKINQTEFCKFMMESIIVKGSPVRDFKKQIVVEARHQGVDCDFHEDRMRLRKKTWRSPGTVYLDHQLMDKDIYIYAGSEMYVEPLEGPEPMKTPTQMQVYIRRWNPSKYTIGPFQEVILDSANPEGLKKKISSVSDIPVDQVAIAKSYGSFPCEVSVLDIEQEMDWNPAVSNVNHAPLSLYDDGGIIYYKDLKEEIMELTQEQKSEIMKSERIRLNRSNVHGTGSSGSGSSAGTYSYYRKEKALKIYTGEEDEDGEHRGKEN